jgi:signal transduction histidine kinase/CheY-like chemotaxis protein
MKMRRVIILAYSAVLAILLINFFYYKSLYDKQINYIVKLLDRQVQIVGLEVDSINNNFVSDLTQIDFSQDLTGFFDKSKPDIQYRIKEQMKLFFSRYKDFVTRIRLYDNSLNEFTLSKDELNNGWIEGEFIALDQRQIMRMDVMEESNGEFNYYGAILMKGGREPFGNIMVTVDYKRYFLKLFSEFNLKEYQWQWVLSDNGEIIFNNSGTQIKYSQLDLITKDLSNGSISNTAHEAIIDGKKREILSSYYSTQLVQRDLGLVFSAKTDFFQKYIIRNSVFIVIGTLLIVQLIILIFWRFIKFQKSEMEKLSDSERMLMSLIEEMPVGVIIHNINREILKSNKVAAGLYSYSNESDMLGKIFPETSLPDNSDYFSKYLGSSFQPDHFVIIKKGTGEIVLYRSSIPVKFKGEDASMEILIDITILESARKQEAKANIAKSEFLARMSYEIRNPLNGIIGMADVLNKYDLSNDVRDVISLLRRSTEVLLGIINDLLDFSKIESGKMILDEIPFNLREEIKYSVDLAKTYVGEKELLIRSVIENKVPESIIGDPFRLRQILTNLISHSVNNTEKGEILLKCRIKEKMDGIIILLFEIQDTGKSIGTTDLKKIFGELLDADSLSVRSIDESGFGTIIARRLVELMGGGLIADSHSEISGNTGNKVTFTIKTYSNERPQKGLDLSNVTHFDQIKTLIITGSQNRDEEFMASIHKLGLSSSVTTFQKSTISQIRANLSLPAENYKMIIITDDEDFDGFEVAKSFWEHRLSLYLVVMIVSSNDKKGNYLRSITLGIDHYLVKPFDPSEFYNAVHDSFTHLENSDDSVGSENLKKEIHILLVEDNKMSQNIMTKMIGSLGYSFDIAEDGYEGYDKAKSKKYDIIFMDLVMPEMDGYESARRILEFDKSYIIVALTADKMPDSKKKAELSGIKEFISKPVRLEELKKLLAKYSNFLPDQIDIS